MNRTFTKAAAISALVAGALFAVPAAASAYTTPVTGETDTATVAPGGVVEFFVDQPQAFEVGETVYLSVTGENASGASLAFVKFAVETKSLGTTTANAEGGIDPVEIRLPANASGTYTFLATSESNPIGAAATVTVASDAGTGADGNGSGSDDDGLAVTGLNSEAMLGLWVGGGALLLAGGGIAVASAVRRNKQNA